MANDILPVSEMQGEVIFYQPDNTMRLEVGLENETVWLTQQQMAELFSTDRTYIARHIGNIYTTDELEEKATCAKIAQVRQEGNRRVKRSMVYDIRFYLFICYIIPDFCRLSLSTSCYNASGGYAIV